MPVCRGVRRGDFVSKTILMGVCGGIAAYKSVDAVSRLRKLGFEVRVAMSSAAQQFVTPLTFAAVSGAPVLTEMFPSAANHQGEQLFPHLYPATRADAYVLAPATADMIARIVHGLGDDVVCAGALALSAGCKRYFCPAMNVNMWRQPVVQENVAALEKRGWVRIGPSSGELACGTVGEGRMSEPAEIVARVVGDLREGLDLSGRTVLVISGPTHEHLDPVRFVGNASSGRMGRALADEAADAGARVLFVTGPVPEANLPAGPSVELHRVVSADEMLKAASAVHAQADIVVYAAAVADYKPETAGAGKLPKTAEGLTLKLVPTPDVAATLNKKRRPGQVCIGFALQTEEGPAKARAKLEAKHLDGIVLNGPESMGGPTGRYTYIDAAGSETWGDLDKHECARRILKKAAVRLAGK